MRSLLNPAWVARPFLCDGSPLDCSVAQVGINPGTDTPFWEYWSASTGLDKTQWLADYVHRHGKLGPTRDRIELFNEAIAPSRCIELNLYPYYSKSLADLSRDRRDNRMFRYLLSLIKPRVIIVHGNEPILEMEKFFGVALERDSFVMVQSEVAFIDVYAAKRHFAYVSRQYIVEVAERVVERLRTR